MASKCKNHLSLGSSASCRETAIFEHLCTFNICNNIARHPLPSPSHKRETMVQGLQHFVHHDEQSQSAETTSFQTRLNRFQSHCLSHCEVLPGSPKITWRWSYPRMTVCLISFPFFLSFFLSAPVTFTQSSMGYCLMECWVSQSWQHRHLGG